MDLFGVSKSKAYKMLKTWNEELQKDGYLTINGKIPKKYVEKKMFGGVSA